MSGSNKDSFSRVTKVHSAEEVRVTTVNSASVTRSITVHPFAGRKTIPQSSESVSFVETKSSERVTVINNLESNEITHPSSSDHRVTTPHELGNDLSAGIALQYGQSNIFNLPPKTSISGEIIITEKFNSSKQGGEAVLYKCHIKDHSEEYIIKIYNRELNEDEIEAKKKIYQELKGLSCVAHVVRSGLYAGFYYEVSLFYQNGSLADRIHEKNFTEQEIRKVLPKLNEALHQIHQVNIIHSDIKPANILYSNDKKDFVLIDFGIAAYTDGRDLVTQFARTVDYSAPELLAHKVAKESDYYSLGISLAEMFSGETPTASEKNGNVDLMLHVMNGGRIRRPNNMSDNLYTLILRMTYPSIMAEETQEEFPLNVRWTYEHIKKWLAVPQLPREIIDKTINPASPAPISDSVFIFPYQNSVYDSFNDLVLAMAHSDVRDAYRYITANTGGSFREALSRLDKNADSRIRNRAAALIEKHKKFTANLPPSIPNEEKVILFYYTFSENLKVLFTTSSGSFTAKNLNELGNILVNTLSKNDWKDNLQKYMPILEHGLLDKYLDQRKTNELTPIEKHLVEMLDSLHKTARLDAPTAYCAMAYAFCGCNMPFVLKDIHFRDIADMNEKIAELESEPKKLFQLLTPLLVDTHHFRPEFTGWLMNQGVQYENISF